MARKARPPRNPAPIAAPPGETAPNPGVNPAVEHVFPAESPPFPIAAIGASAGGLEAFTELLRALPADTGMAFVLVQHLVPTHQSMLSEILSRATAMPVREIENNMAVEPDHVYVIPPGKSLVIGHGLLQLAPRTEVKGVARPIDHFMRSLAEEHGYKAIGVVLSGTGTDGTLGLQEIKAGGGFTFAQDSTAAHPGMPTSAVSGGAVDMVLPADEIARELGRIAAHPYVVTAEQALPTGDSAFARVVETLESASGVEFTSYKKNTLFRRITRRMTVRRVDGMDQYAQLLQREPSEVEALYHDVLINVTSFFRNPEAYEAIKAEVFPALVADRKRAEVRVWALGCSTGEEAYSLAIAFTEYLEQSGKRIGLQLFATDLNSAGIERARAGVYPKGIEQDVSPERLRRYFVEVDGSYRIAKPIRDMCVFARQNVITDPPFSRIDLVACRNMLIYLEPALQQKLIPLLHFALRPHGFLWLGGSETIGSYRDLFETVDSHNKIYAKKYDADVRAPAFAGRERGGSSRWPPDRALPAAGARKTRGAAQPDAALEADRLLLARYAPPAVVVDEALDVVQYRGDTGHFLTPSPGKASLSLLKMLREDLVVPVRGALHRAKSDGKPVRVETVRVKLGDGWREVDVVAAPLGSGAGGFVVLFEEPIKSREARAKSKHAEADANIDRKQGRSSGTRQDGLEVSRLSQELAATREYLQSVIEEQESVNEELQSANEEAQSTNEEMQSINEELETSKEEIQSSNEELATLNQELGNRNTELARINNDLVNFVTGTSISIVMLGRDLRIRRFTPMAEKNMNLTAADLGRPLGDIRTNLGIDDLEELVREVIDTMGPREREVRDRAGRWYSLRVRPYRTLENQIDGAVLVLVDIDEIKRAQFALLESEQRFELLADSAPVLIWVNDREGARFVNRAFEDFVGAKEHDIRVAEPGHYVHPDDRPAYRDAFERAFSAKERFEIRCRLRRGDGVYRWMKSVATPSFLPNGELLGLVGCTFDITDMQDAQAALIEFDHGKDEFLAMLAHELRNPLAGIHNALRVLTLDKDPAQQARGHEIIKRQSENMARMVEELLDVARVTHGKIVLRPKPLDLVALARRMVLTTQAVRAERQQQLTAALPQGPLWIDGDALRLEQVVANLLDNAHKFTRSGGHIWLGVESEMVRFGAHAQPAVVLRVRDNGLGIAPTLLPRVFDLFSQGHLSSDRARAGIGVGLSLAKRLVDLHGGSIEAFSAGEALGSEFVVRLPMLAESRIPAPADPSPSLAHGAARVKRKVLVIDDNHDATDSLGTLLRIAGHDVQIAYDGESGVAAAADFEPDAVLVDIALPDIDGYEVVRRLRKSPRGGKIRFMAISGFGRPEDLQRSADAGVEAHFTKPLDFDQLAERLQRSPP